MNENVKRDWIAALRSDRFTQGTGALKVGNDTQIRHCCLGVLCELAEEAGVGRFQRVGDSPSYETRRYYFDGEPWAFLPYSVMEWAGLESESPRVNGTSLSRLNDDLLVNFDRIADLIEEHL